MAEKQDIAMNAFQIVTDADYVYVEKGNSQRKIEKNVFIDIVKRYITSVRFTGSIPDSDLNSIYKNEESGISIYNISAAILNSPATYSFCINIQRSGKGDVPDDNLVNLRTGKGDGEKIVYTSWRRI